MAASTVAVRRLLVRAGLAYTGFEALRRAAGAVRTQMLSRLLVDRFGLDAAPEQDPAVTGEPSALMNDPETAALARRFFDELSGEERALLRDPAAVAAAVHHDPQAAALVLRLRAWAGSELRCGRCRCAVDVVRASGFEVRSSVMSSDEHVRGEGISGMLNLPPLTFDDLVDSDVTLGSLARIRC